MFKQKTLRAPARLSGVGLHSGKRVEMTVLPAKAGEGISFVLEGQTVCAHHEAVDHTPLCTLLRGDDGLSISTIEHFMAAAWALGLSNLYVHLSSDELPIMDGSAMPFFKAMLSAGIVEQAAMARTYCVERSVTVSEGSAWATLSPAKEFSASIEIDFPVEAIGRQHLSFNGSVSSFEKDIAQARTFCMSKDVVAMHKSGRALGGSLDNAVVFDTDGIVNPTGMRFKNEPVRHKMLDALGDLYLAGGRILGRYEGNRPGHRLTNLLLREAFHQGALIQVRDKARVSDIESVREMAA